MKIAIGITFFVVTIPDDVSFDDLNLAVQENGVLDFDWRPLRRIAEVNTDFDLEDEAGIFNLIEAWYNQLRLTGYWNEVGEKWFVTSEAPTTFYGNSLLTGPDTLN